MQADDLHPRSNKVRTVLAWCLAPEDVTARRCPFGVKRRHTSTREETRMPGRPAHHCFAASTAPLTLPLADHDPDSDSVCTSPIDFHHDISTEIIQRGSIIGGVSHFSLSAV